jgi:hypothetical protein
MVYAMIRTKSLSAIHRSQYDAQTTMAVAPRDGQTWGTNVESCLGLSPGVVTNETMTIDKLA